MYWLDKINLFKRSSLHYHANIAVSSSVLKLLQLSLIFYSSSVLLYTYKETNAIDNYLLAAFITSFLFVLFVFFAPKRLTSFIFGR